MEEEAQQAGVTGNGRPETIPFLVALVYGVLALAWIILSDLLLARMVTDARWLAVIGAVKGIGFVTLTTLLLYLVLRRLMGGQWGIGKGIAEPRLSWLGGATVIFLLAVFLLVLQSMSAGHRAQEVDALHTLSRLKAEQAGAWLRERRQDVAFMAKSGPLQQAIGKWRRDADPGSRLVILSRMESVRQVLGYDTVLLADRRGEIILGDESEAPLEPETIAPIKRALETGEPSMGKIYQPSTGSPGEQRLDLVAPIAGLSDHGALALVMSLRGEALSFTFLQDRASTTASGDILLLRQGVTSLEVLNQPRFASRDEAGMRLDLATSAHVAAAAARNGTSHGEPLSGEDFSGTPVIGVSAQVPGADWWVLAKKSEQEIFSAVSNRIFWAAALFLLLTLAILAVTRLWIQSQKLALASAQQKKQQENIALQKMITAERENSLAVARRYQDFIENAQEIILTTNAKGRIVQANAAASKAYGWEHSELLGKRLRELELGDAPAADERRNSKVESRPGMLHESRHRRRDGSDFPVEISSRVVELDGDVHRQHIIRDISNREAARRQLDANARLLEMASAIARIGGWEVDLRSRRVTWSDEVCRIHEVPPGTLLALDQALEYYPREWQERIKTVFDACATHGVRFQEELQILTANNRKVWVRSVGEAVRSDDGEIIGVQGAFQDITLEKSVSENLREREEQLALLIEYAPAGLAMFDREMRYLATSQRWRETFGRGELEVPGVSHYDAFPEIGEERRMAHRRGLRGEIVRADEDAMEFIDGTIHWMRWEVRPWFRVDREVGGIIILTEDVTEKKCASLELERHRQHLEELVVERTAQLDEARERAESANRSKSEFLANMSHEIRTPLNAIVGLLYILRNKDPTPEQEEKLVKVENAARHLLSIISDILDISKIEAGKFVLSNEDFHLSAVLDNVYSMIAASAREKGIAVDVDPDGVPHWLRGDPARLRQALLNLAANALKFTDKGAINLRAILLGEYADSLHVRFEVEDTGIGISPEHVGDLFQAFEQGESSITRNYGGTGLGLMVTRRLAELMGGGVGVRSEPGEGSLFWFEVRLARGRGIAPDEFAPRSPIEEGVETFRRFAGAPILLVEDNEINLEVALVLLRGVGLRVDCARNGQEAVAMASAREYALVLMDVQMPLLDGFSATREIRKLPDGERVPILAMTANVFEEDRRQAADAGMDDFIAKPVKTDQLYKTLLHWLKKGRSVAATEIEPHRGDFTPVEHRKAVGGHFAAISGVESTKAIATGGGDESSYLRLMRKLLEQHQADPGLMRASLAKGEVEAVRTRACSLKGAAGSLGIKGVSTAAAELEHAAASTEDPAHLEALLDSLAEALDALAPLLWAEPGSGTGGID